jgi:hypothetical protein
MNNGSYFWTSSQPTELVAEQPARMVQLTVARVINPPSAYDALRLHARAALGGGQTVSVFLNPNHVSHIIDAG